MNITDGIKLRGRPAEIPAASRDDLPAFCLARGYQVGAEIGVYKGAFTKLFLDAGLRMYAIDPWRPYDGFDVISDVREDRQQAIYEHVQRAIGGDPNCTILRQQSMEAVQGFADDSLDFVYIDGNHRFRYVADDLCEWWKKLKSGGMMAGHDYIHPRRMNGNRLDNLQVKFVVDAFVEAYRIPDWWLIGRRDAPWGERRDRFLSYMWIKP